VNSRQSTRQHILEFALSFPAAFEDHPWDDTVVKVNKKIFVFLGHEDTPESGMSVKLRESHEQALGVPGATPTGYGLGRAGWVDVPFGDVAPPPPVLKDWVQESYCLIAPKRLVAELETPTERR
jgi:predicted DNA-binding protein (MmcQ/YjbR family)